MNCSTGRDIGRLPDACYKCLKKMQHLLPFWTLLSPFQCSVCQKGAGIGGMNAYLSSCKQKDTLEVSIKELRGPLRNLPFAWSLRNQSWRLQTRKVLKERAIVSSLYPLSSLVPGIQSSRCRQTPHMYANQLSSPLSYLCLDQICW